jgi:hypothetical protein
LPAVEVLIAPGLALAVEVIRSVARSDVGADGDDEEGDEEGEDKDEDDAVRGRTGPFPRPLVPLPFGGVSFGFNASSPLWRHRRLPAP